MISERVKQIRENNHLTQKQLAECLDLKHEKIRDIENDKQKLNIEIAQKIEDKFNINLRWLLTGRGDKYITSNLDKICYCKDNEEINELLTVLQDVPKSWITSITERVKKSLLVIEKDFK